MRINFGPAKHLPGSSCPVCRKPLDGATPTSLDGKSADFTPKPGDFSVCIYCGTVLRFEIGQRIKAATEDELKELYDHQPDTFAALRMMAAAATRCVHDRQRKNYGRN